MLETHENIESIAAEAADGVAATSAARWEQLRCATRELLRLTRQRDNVRSFPCTCALWSRSARLRPCDFGTQQGVQGAVRARLSVWAGLRAVQGARNLSRRELSRFGRFVTLLGLPSMQLAIYAF